MTTIVLRTGHVQPVWAGHPWIFAQAIDRLDGAPQAGDEVSVVDPKGTFLGRGLWSPNSAIRVRIFTREQNEALDAKLLHERFESALRFRKIWLDIPNAETNAFRLIHADADRLPGLIVDMYGDDTACAQFLTVGMKMRQELILGELIHATGVKTIVEFANAKVQKLEGFTASTGALRGNLPDSLLFKERGFEYRIPLSQTHQKTGFYFDQRDNRSMIEKWAKDKLVLDAFSYVGAFSLAAARGGAKHVVAIDSSASAVAVGALHSQHLGYGDQIEWVCADVRNELKKRTEQKEKFDLVILDPPKLVPSRKHLDKGKRAYRDINALAMRLLDRNGMLLTCSCSAGMDSGEFMRMIALAAGDARRQVAVVASGAQAPDHPMLPGFPEGSYLKAVFLRVL